MTAPIEPGHVMSREKYNNIQFEQLAQGWLGAWMGETSNAKAKWERMCERNNSDGYESETIRDFSEKIGSENNAAPT